MHTGDRELCGGAGDGESMSRPAITLSDVWKAVEILRGVQSILPALLPPRLATVGDAVSLG